jgi:Tfp pilus assembly protein PilF
MLFIPLALWAYLRKGWTWYAVAMVLFVLALLSKEQSAVLPGLFLLADLIWPDDCTNWRRRIVRWSPILAIFAGYFLVRHIIFGGRSIHVDVWNHPLQPLVSLLYGLQTTIAPFVDLRYEPPANVWFSWPLSALSVLMLGVLVFGIVKSVRPIVLAAVFWLAWFVLLQLPTAHIVAEQEAPFSERYVALATLAFPALAAAMVSQFRRAALMKVAVAMAMIWITVLGVISFARGEFYANDLAFDGQWELSNPQSSVAHSGMGVAYEKRGDTDRALAEYNAALACNPDDWTANDNLGVILLNRGQYWPAEKHLRIVVAAHIHDPQIMVNYGITLEMLSMQQKNIPFRNAARKWFEHAINSNPNDANAHFELGAWQARFGDPAIARKELQTALSLNPHLRQARVMLDQLNQPKPR